MNNHLFPYSWNLSDGYPAKNIIPNNKKVFGTFICGGGSTMGYKLAGYTHIGGVEIDPKVAAVYDSNHHPKHLFVEDIRRFNERTDLPEDLFDLDILDGSPPCSSFSMAGNREKDWGKEKQFKEGQAFQILDDLVFEYCNTIIKLQPKIAILENVKGLIQGNAKQYVIDIMKKLKSAGFKAQLFLLNSATMGVPQKRERVFFIIRKESLSLPDLKLNFHEHPILFSKIINYSNTECDLTEYQKQLWDSKTKKDKSFGDIIARLENRLSMFSNPIIHCNDVAPTVTSSAGVNALFDIPRNVEKSEYCKIGSYPLDYNFNDIKPEYLIGMSVPPVMTAQIANQIFIQWLSKIN